MGRVIAIGSDPGMGTVDLILRSYEHTPQPRPGLTVHRAETPAEATVLLRAVFAEHRAITTLGGARVVGDDPAWTAPIEARLCEFLEDLGNCPLDAWQGARNAIRNGAAIATGHTSFDLFDALKGHPAICVGSGPSATPEMLREVARLSRNHYIFACDTIVDALHAAGCTPHFVCMLERPPEMQKTISKARRASTLIAPPVVDPECVKPFGRAVFWWAGDELYPWLDPTVPPANCGRSAGTLSVAAAVLAGCNSIHLIGHDLCYAPGFKSYTDVAHPLAHSTWVDSTSRHANGGYGAARIQVPGYSQHPVWTCGMWNLFRSDIESIVAANPDRRFFNAAADFQGAFIAGISSYGSLPEHGPAQSVDPQPRLPSSTVRNPAERIPSILADLEKLHEAAVMAQVALRDDACPLNQLSAELGMSRIVSIENVRLFRYITRPIYTSLELRLHMRAEHLHEPERLQRDCLSLLASTLEPLALRLARELR